MKETKSKNIWTDRVWNIVLVIIGGLITIGTTQYFNYSQLNSEKDSLIKVIQIEVTDHVEQLKNQAIALENIKKGKFPELGKKESTLDRSLEGGSLQLSGRLGLTHDLVILESIKPSILILPPDIIKCIIDFEKSLKNCALQKEECESAINERINKVVKNPAPTCEIYYELVVDAENQGIKLLSEIQHYLSD